MRPLVPTMLAAILITLVVAGCQSASPNTSTLDSWIRTADIKYFIDAPEDADLPHEAIHEVAKPQLSIALTRLEKKAWVEVSDKEAADLCGYPMPHAASGMRLFLVRGVCAHRDGEFLVCFVRGRLWVSHGSMGTTLGQIERQPLVLALPTPPREVYVSVEVIQ